VWTGLGPTRQVDVTLTSADGRSLTLPSVDADRMLTCALARGRGT